MAKIEKRYRGIEARLVNKDHKWIIQIRPTGSQREEDYEDFIIENKKSIALKRLQREELKRIFEAWKIQKKRQQNGSN